VVKVDNIKERGRLAIHTSISYAEVRYDDVEELLECLSNKYMLLMSEGKINVKLETRRPSHY